MRKISAAAIVLVLVMVAGQVSAQTPWSLLLADPIQSGSPGSMLTFHGTVDNYTGQDLNGIFLLAFNLNSEGHFGLPTLYGDSGFASEFVTWLPASGSLPAYGHYEGPLFKLTWLDAAPVGFWQNGQLIGSFGGFQPSRNWQASVSAPPVSEPGSLALLVCGLIGLPLLRRRR
jgi:hypothetical protein